MTTTEAPEDAVKPDGIKPVRFTETDGPVMAQAVGLALGLMNYLRLSTWDEVTQAAVLYDNVDEYGEQRRRLAALVLSEHQHAILDRHANIFSWLRLNPVVSIAYCPECFTPTYRQDGEAGRPGDFVGAHGWVLASRAAPTKCRLTPGCPGKPVKVRSTPKVTAPRKAPAPKPDTTGEAAPAPDEELPLDLPPTPADDVADVLDEDPPAEDVVDFDDAPPSTAAIVRPASDFDDFV